MTARMLPPGIHGFDDVTETDCVVTGSVCVTAEKIDAFAEISGDRFGIHMSCTEAARHGFPGRVAHGLLVLSLVDGLKNQAAAQFRAQASLGWNWSFSAPVFAGDRISARITVLEKRRTRDPARGILRLGFEVVNQEASTVQRGENLLMTYR